MPEPLAPSVPPSAPAASAAYGLPAADPLTQPLVDFLPPAAAPAVLPTTVPVTVPVTGVAAPQDAVEATWPCSACQNANPLSVMACLACGQSFLSGVREDGRTRLVLPVVGDLAAMSRGRRLSLALALVAAVLVPLALLTLLLTERPEAGPDDRAPDVSITTTVP